MRRAATPLLLLLLALPYLWLALTLNPARHGQDFLENGWLPARLLTLGDNPYAPDSARVHQLADLYTPDRDPVTGTQFNSGSSYHAIYPYWAMLAVTPLAALDFPTALIVWTVLGGLLLVVGLHLAMAASHRGGRTDPAHTADWLPTPVLSLGLLLFLAAGSAYIVYRPALVNLYIGQHSLIVFALLAAVYYLSSQPADVVNGRTDGAWLLAVLLALAAFKPQLVALPVLLAVVVWLMGRRWLPVAVVVGVGASLYLGPLLFAPRSLGDWLAVSFQTQGQAVRMAPVATSWWGTSYNLAGGAWTIMAAAASLLTLLLLITPWRRAIRSGRIADALPLTVIIALLVSPYTLVYDQVLLLLPFATLWQRSGQAAGRTALYLRGALLLWLTVGSVVVGVYAGEGRGYIAVVQPLTLLLLYYVVGYLSRVDAPQTTRA